MANVEVVRVMHGIDKKGNPYVRVEVLPGDMPAEARPFVEAQGLWGDASRIAAGSVQVPCHAHIRLEVTSDGSARVTNIKPVPTKGAA